jgi:AcrR family transcriptional regulator
MSRKASGTDIAAQSVSLEDPMTTLPPAAQRILAAARRLLAQGGFNALRLQAIAREADEPKASIAYYFGNKEGLISALVDSLIHDANRQLIEDTERLPVGQQRIHALVDGETRIVSDSESFRMFFDVLPHVLRDDKLRPRVARLYDGYRETVLRCLGAPDAAARSALLPLAMLMIAIVDGLAIQEGLDPEKVVVQRATQLWEELLDAYLSVHAPTRPTAAAAGPVDSEVS